MFLMLDAKDFKANVTLSHERSLNSPLADKRYQLK